MSLWEGWREELAKTYDQQLQGISGCNSEFFLKHLLGWSGGVVQGMPPPVPPATRVSREAKKDWSRAGGRAGPRSILLGEPSYLQERSGFTQLAELTPNNFLAPCFSCSEWGLCPNPFLKQELVKSYDSFPNHSQSKSLAKSFGADWK